MGILCSTNPKETKRSNVTQPQRIINNGKTRSCILGDRLPILLVMASYAFLVGVLSSDVSRKALPSTEATPMMSDIRMAPPFIIATVQVRAATSEAPTQPAPPPSTPPPPSPLSEIGQVLQFQEVVYSLRATNYTRGFDYILEYLFLLSLGSTLFVLTNATFNGLLNTFASLGPLLSYHAILQQLTNAQIMLLAVGAQFATMANNNTITVTSIGNFQVDDVCIILGDICTSVIWAM